MPPAPPPTHTHTAHPPPSGRLVLQRPASYTADLFLGLLPPQALSRMVFPQTSPLAGLQVGVLGVKGFCLFLIAAWCAPVVGPDPLTLFPRPCSPDLLPLPLYSRPCNPDPAVLTP